MRKNYRTVRTRLVLLTLWLAGAWFLAAAGGGCTSPPKLTPEDRREDIEFLAHWARDYSPLVKLNEKYKGTPSYEALLPKYVEFAEQAQNDEEFWQVVEGYFKIVGASGHAYLLPDSYLKWGGIGTFLGLVKMGITPGQFEQARYWPRLVNNLSTRAHPPFPVVSKEGRYFTGGDWQHEGTVVPKGAEILRVNGMSCSDYLDFIKTGTPLKYDPYPKNWADPYLMIIDEGSSFHGWQVDFGLPDGRTLSAFVPKVKGFPAPAQEKVHTQEPKENCTCLELTDDVGYIRIRSFMGHPLDVLFKSFIRHDGKKIRAFLARSHGKYRKLIIDVRNNGGGLPEYFYENLIRPFLDQPVTYQHEAGLRRRFLRDTSPAVLRQLRKPIMPRYVTGMKEVTPPEGFDEKEWVFYRITRRLEPSRRFAFTGEMYVLINGGCFSACDDYPSTVKRIGLATLVGQTTGGAGAIGYCMTPFVRLPRSGMIFALDIHLPRNPDGSFSALHGLEPDVKLPDTAPPRSFTKEDLLQDEWIKQVIAGLRTRAGPNTH
jgi:hypothetical protein